MTNLRNNPLPDEVIANLVGLTDLRIGRHSSDREEPPGDRDFWVQSIWRARVLPAFDANAFLAVVTCAEPWQPGAVSQTGLWARGKRILGVRSVPPTIGWRKAVLALHGVPVVAELPHDPVSAALREVDLFETYEHGSLDGIGYSLDVETWNLRACLTFGNPEVPSLRRLAKALLAVGQEVGRTSGSGPVAEYFQVLAQSESEANPTR